MGLCWVFAGKVCVVVFIIFCRLVSDLVLLCANVSDVCSTESVPLLSAVANVAVGAGGGLRYPLLYLIDEYVSKYASMRAGLR